MLDGRTKMINSPVAVLRCQGGNPEGLLSRTEAGDTKTADHRQVSIRAK
jgi:hypothetical protein